MANGKKKIASGASAGKRTRIIISINYIIAGASILIPKIASLSSLGFDILLVTAGGAFMLVAGILGLLDAKRPVCRVLGIILFCIFAASLILRVVRGGDLDPLTLIAALISWLFITVV
ncbi:MAG: hypothetical protein ILO42_04615 [Clostridia bacterium]|nr:hypothetical protein [Clostridia bacterium]